MKKFFAFLIAGAATLFLPFAAHADCSCGKPKVQKTLSIVKPDAVSANHIGEISARFEKEGLKVVAAKMVKLTPEEAATFYAAHKERPFYNSLVSFMSSGPIYVQVLEGEDAVAKNRILMGATNPKNAEPNTLRALYASDVEKNAVHGSDSLEAAKKEIAFFFKDAEIYSR
jgi:nucleoside-diphosphate kinase